MITYVNSELLISVSFDCSSLVSWSFYSWPPLVSWSLYAWSWSDLVYGSVLFSDCRVTAIVVVFAILVSMPPPLLWWQSEWVWHWMMFLKYSSSVWNDVPDCRCGMRSRYDWLNFSLYCFVFRLDHFLFWTCMFGSVKLVSYMSFDVTSSRHWEHIVSM